MDAVERGKSFPISIVRQTFMAALMKTPKATDGRIEYQSCKTISTLGISDDRMFDECLFLLVVERVYDN